MKEKMEQEIKSMGRTYQNTYRAVDKLAKRHSMKDFYFILKRYYAHVDDTNYKPEFPV